MSTSKKLKLGTNFLAKDGKEPQGPYGGSLSLDISHYHGSFGEYVKIISDGKHGNHYYMTPTDALALSFILFDFAAEAGVVPKED